MLKPIVKLDVTGSASSTTCILISDEKRNILYIYRYLYIYIQMCSVWQGVCSETSHTFGDDSSLKLISQLLNSQEKCPVFQFQPKTMATKLRSSGKPSVFVATKMAKKPRSSNHLTGDHRGPGTFFWVAFSGFHAPKRSWDPTTFRCLANVFWPKCIGSCEKQDKKKQGTYNLPNQRKFRSSNFRLY